MKFLRDYAVLLLLMSIVLVIISVLFLPIFMNLSGQLFDWNDYPLIVWIIDQHIDHISSGTVHLLFQSNMFSGFRDSLLFSDLLLPTAFLTGMVSILGVDRVAAFNFVFFTTWLLNTYAALFMWRKIWSGPQLVASVLFTVFMPFVVINLSHFQLIALWPFLFALSLLFEAQRSWKQAFWLGVWTSITFVSSVYLAVFLLYIIGVWHLVEVLNGRSQLASLVGIYSMWLAVFIATVLVLAGPFVLQYYQMREFYHAERAYSEYVNYSAGLLDYVSSSSYFSIFSSVPWIQHWNATIASSAGGFFPGVVLLGLSLASLTFSKKSRPLQYGVGMVVNRRSVFFAILVISGFVFSLGPRLKIGTVYVGPPLPYSVLLKFVPLFEPIRAPVRWQLLLSIGLVYFATEGLGKLLQLQSTKSRKWVITCMAVGFFFLELLPVYRPIQPPGVGQVIDQHLVPLCKDAPVLLEYPITHNPYGDHRGIVQMLQHWTGSTLDAIVHDCRVVNGYSGYFPAEYTQYENRVREALESGDVGGFATALQDRGVQLLRIHTEKLTASESATLAEWADLSEPEQVFQSQYETMFSI